MTAKAAARQDLVWVTSAGYARDHAVIAETLAASRRANAQVQAKCGALFWPAPLVAEPGPSCSLCLSRVRACREGDGAEGARNQRREGIIGRWLRTVQMGGAVRRNAGEPATEAADDAAHDSSRKAHS